MRIAEREKRIEDVHDSKAQAPSWTDPIRPDVLGAQLRQTRAMMPSKPRVEPLLQVGVSIRLTTGRAFGDRTAGDRTVGTRTSSRSIAPMSAASRTLTGKLLNRCEPNETLGCGPTDDRADCCRSIS